MMTKIDRGVNKFDKSIQFLLQYKRPGFLAPLSVLCSLAHTAILNILSMRRGRINKKQIDFLSLSGFINCCCFFLTDESTLCLIDGPVRT